MREETLGREQDDEEKEEEKEVAEEDFAQHLYESFLFIILCF